MNLIPGQGVDAIKLGITQLKLIQTLGEPDKIVYIEFMSNERFVYNDLMTTFSFDPDEENKLTSIETSNYDVCLWGCRIIGMSKNAIIDFLYKHNVNNITSEIYDTFETLYCDEINLELKIEFETVRRIEFWCFFDENDDVIWP